VVPPASVVNLNNMVAGRDWCLQELFEGRVDVYLDSKVVLLERTFDYCNRLHMVADIDFAPVYVGFAVTGDPAYNHLARNLQTTVSKVQASPIYNDLLSQYLHLGQACVADTGHETEGLSVASMSGVFIIAGSLTGLSLMLAVIERCCAKPDTRDAANGDLPPSILGAAAECDVRRL